MTDFVEITPGTGAKVSTDTIGSVEVQRVKVQHGADGSATDVSTASPLPTRARLGATASVTAVADSASSQTLIAANADRISLTITNDSSARLYVRYGAAPATTTDYTFSLGVNETAVIDDYAGEVRGIWASDPGDGAARITEVSA